MKKKALFSLILSLALCVGLAVPAFADGDSDPDFETAYFVIGNKTYSMLASSSGTGWSYDAGTHTLTLNGYTGDRLDLYNAKAPFYLTLADGSVNTIGTPDEADHENFTVWTQGGLIIQGNGTLVVEGSAEICDSVTVKSGTISINGGSWRGLYLNESTRAGLHIEGGSVTVLNGISSRSPSENENPITVTGGELILGPAQELALELNTRGANVTGLENAYAVDQSGAPLTLGVYNTYYNTYYTASGSAATYAKITAASQTPAQVSTEKTAYATSYSILVDGQAVAFDAYALKDENGNDTNYLKLRDVAHVLNGSAAQFDVGWDGSAGAISITTGTPYVSTTGSEMSTPFSGNQPYTASTSAILIDGAPANLSAITLTDSNGGGYNYFKLRDLGQALGFSVDWDASAGAIVIDTTKG